MIYTVSVIIPVYNAPDAVKRCLQSVLDHTDLSRNRVLMINDSSSDELVRTPVTTHYTSTGTTDSVGCLYVANVEGSDLTSGYEWVRLGVTNAANQVLSVTYVLYGSRLYPLPSRSQIS